LVRKFRLSNFLLQIKLLIKMDYSISGTGAIGIAFAETDAEIIMVRHLM